LRSKTTRRFRQAFSRLPTPIKDRARDAYRRFAEDPDHPGLNFKRLRTTEPIYSVRVSSGYRAIGVKQDDTMIWFWIGSHAEYDDLLSRM
jgi:hypothetical protein